MSTAGRKGYQAVKGVLSWLAFAAVGLAVGLVLLAITVFHILPIDIAEKRLNAHLKGNGIVVSWQSIGTAFPLGVKAEGIEVIDLSTGRPVVRFEEAEAHLDFRGFLHGALLIPISARMGGGFITGEVHLRSKGIDLRMEADDILIGSIPFVADSGVTVKGLVGGTLYLQTPWGGCPAGLVRLRSGRFDGSAVRFMGSPLPLGEIDGAGLNAEFRDCKVVIEGLWLDASELFAKLAGEIIPGAPVKMSRINMTLDVVPKGDVSSKHLLLSFISAYRKASNYYSMNLRGTIARPVIGR